MPESSATAAECAARATAYTCHLFAVEGLPYLWTDDTTGELLGSGAGTWMGESEDALGLDVGSRTILPGLKCPSFKEGIDPKVGTLQKNSATIKLIDRAGELAALFATEGKAFSILGADIQPGNTALGTSVAISGNLTINPRGRYIGLERIGPAGERGYWSPFTFPLLGKHHPVNLFGQGEEGPRPIPISDSPLDFTGRLVSVYRLVRRQLPMLTGYEAWPLWDDQASVEGALVWWGKLTDKGTVGGNREWSLRCDGALSLLQRQLNQWAPGWGPISDAPRTLSAEQRMVAIRFAHNEIVDDYDYPNDLSVGYTSTFSATGDQETWIPELNALIQAVASGATSDYGVDPVEDWHGAEAGILDDGTIFVRRNTEDDPGERGGVLMQISMHETIWRSFGFDPPLQATAPPFSETTQIPFVPVNAGEFVFGPGAVNGSCPADGFYAAELTTMSLDSNGLIYSLGNGAASNNGGTNRRWEPINPGNPLILAGPAEVPQLVRLQVDQPYLESVPSVPRSDAEVAGSEVTHARYFAIRGQKASGNPTGPGAVQQENGETLKLEDVEAEDFGTVVRGEWREASYGALVEEDGRPTLSIARYENPMLAGVPFLPMDSEWSALATAKGPGLEIAPLMTYGYGVAMSLGRAIECWYQLLLSTGSAAGFATDESTDPDFVEGLNSHAGQSQYWCWDALRADHGLGVPAELVAEPDVAVTEFDKVPGGAGGALSRIGLAYVGAQDSLSVVESIIRPRGLACSLDGGRYGVVFLAPFSPFDATVSIGTADLYGRVDDPASTIPSQQLRAVGQLDRVSLKYRYNPLDGETAIEKEYRARDREAQARRGDLKLELVDHGLVPTEWQVPGVDSWSLAFRDLWEVDRSEFFARRHFLVTDLTVNRLVGARCRVGTRVLLTNPWPVNPAGAAGDADAQGYGLTDACGIVIDWQYNAQERSYSLQLLVFAGQFTGARLFMPIGRMVSQAGASITMEPEDAERGISGASRFARPPFSSANQARIRFLSHDRTAWYLSSTYEIASVAGDVVTLTGTPTASDVYRDRDVYMIVAEMSQQTGRWPAAHGSPIVLDTLQHPGGQGFPLEP